MEGMMEWVKQVMIIFDTREPREMLGAHNGKYQAVELRLRSDGKMFYMGKQSKLLPLKTVMLMGAQREDRWNKFLIQETEVESVTEDQFFDHAEDERKRLSGAYL